jgi:benzoyl-CoA reductase/2-hydroxyglutaryl-CoA dehydratase subunit BcrC/BadD/HgdB
MADFLETHTGHKFDLDRLREVCDESNKTYALWQEYNELRRAVPCPHGWEIGGAQAFAVSQCFVAGDPRCTRWFEQLVECAEARVEAGRGANDNVAEKIRLLWFDIMPYGWVFDFMPWLEEEWGAVLVMDMFSNFPYTTIDTSSEESIFHDLAKRNLMDVPMIRQARGTAENFSSDIARMVKDYKLDCVIWPGHMGHKDGAATAGIMRETCRDLGVPFLHIGLDLFDRRYTTVDEIKDRVSQFFNGMGLG